jgi:hypothetical protein
MGFQAGAFLRVGNKMAARVDSVAKYICAKSGWTVSNLQLQKLLYMAQMVHMGRNGGRRLFDGTFQAWDYGPVEPNVYHKLKRYGSSPVGDAFFDALSFEDGELVDITHWPSGAWAKVYVPKAKSIVIPDAAIAEEYNERNKTR